jgi:excisionase family DNA binding protein
MSGAPEATSKFGLTYLRSTASLTLVSTESSEGRYLDTVEASRLLGVTRWTVGRWCKSGWIANARKPGKHWQIPERSVLALLVSPAIQTFEMGSNQ